MSLFAQISNRLLLAAGVLFASTAFVQAEVGPIVVVVGTRPEAIKMVPVYKALKAAQIPTVLCSTGQHSSMLDEIFSLFDLKPDFDFKIMKPGQDLFHITHAVLAEAQKVFSKIKPSWVIVQGDTSSAFAAALAAFYLKIPVAHVEAGLRTHDIYAPFPEEMNRQILTRLATLHFAPTDLAKECLLKEGVKNEQIFCTGNTVIDALYEVRDLLEAKKIVPTQSIADQVADLKKSGKKIILLTAHRRESFGEGLEHIFSAVKTALQQHPELTVVYPMHPNPAIKVALQKVALDTLPNLILMPPVSYHDMVYLLTQVDGVATDSGGIQEEAVSLQNPTLVLRNETDRPEGLKEGLAILVGTEQKRVLEGVNAILEARVTKLKNYISPYGDGCASKRIAEVVTKKLNLSPQIALD